MLVLAILTDGIGCHYQSNLAADKPFRSAGGCVSKSKGKRDKGSFDDHQGQPAPAKPASTKPASTGSANAQTGGVAQAGKGGAAAIERVVASSGGSIRQAVTEINRGGLSQSEAVQAITRVTAASGRNIGGVVDVAGGAKVVTGVVQGTRQPIVHISTKGTASFGSADVAFEVDAAGNLITRVTNVVLP